MRKGLKKLRVANQDEDEDEDEDGKKKVFAKATYVGYII